MNSRSCMVHSTVLGQSVLRRSSSLSAAITDPLLGLNAKERGVYLEALAFGEKHFTPQASYWDEHSIYPRELMLTCGKHGYGGMMVSERFGGKQLSRKEVVCVVEALARACVSTTAMLTIHNAVVGIADKYSTPSIRDKWVSGLTSMEHMGSFCLTEPGSGSDAASLVTKADFDAAAQEYIINGEKCFISGAGMSAIYMVMCRTAPTAISCIAVPLHTPGLSFGHNEKKMGWRSQPTRQVRFEDVRVPAANLIGQEGQGFRIAMSGLDGGRLNIAACSIGAATTCLNILVNHLQQKPGGPSQTESFAVADMFGKLHSSRLILRAAADMLDQRHPAATVYCAFAKQISTDHGSAICGDVMQLLGIEGLLQTTQVERFVRDIRVHQILEGTNEIMRHIIGRSLVA